ncbi:hypothetical protein [uncultured Algimonas sp.]|uniref:hypothetical protein n=1 Tax=uncultured Algimonas sp. TaxID=1547920 RepID=UPI00262824DD|nr:hypothetical protein [uncultured Algimonas sp.]
MTLASGCATSTPDTPREAGPLEDRSKNIVIAADSDGVGASWSSVTDSPLARTATELSNLGGAPVVLGAVGLIMAADSAPKRRAKRIATALRGDLDPAVLDRELAERISGILPDPDDAADAPAVRIKAFERPDDLAREGYVVNPGYALARDGSALRITADIVHADVLDLEQRVAREMRRIELASNRDDGMRRSSRRLRQLQNEWRALPRHYRGRIVYHSDPLQLPPRETLSPADPAVQLDLREALDAEREGRKRAAEAIYADAAARATKPRHAAKAERRRDKALTKADSLHAKGMDKLADAEIDKMEGLLLAAKAWREPASDGQSALSDAIDKGHAFIAEAVGTALFGVGTLENPDEPSRAFAGADLLRQDEDGRLVMRVTEGREAGTILSVPAAGEAEYGGSVAQP